MAESLAKAASNEGLNISVRVDCNSATNELRGRPVGVVWVRKEELVYYQTNRWPPNLGRPAWFIYLSIGGAAPKPRLRAFPFTLLRIGNTYINQPFILILNNLYIIPPSKLSVPESIVRVP